MDIRSSFDNKTKGSDPDKITRFFKRKGIKPDQIKYILRENDKTAIYLKDDRVVETYITANDIMSQLPQELFYNINRGTYVSIADIATINQNAYTMLDGRKIMGRAYLMDEHNANKTKLLHSVYDSKEESDDIKAGFSGMDNYPGPVYILKAFFDKNGRSIDLIFEYANRATQIVLKMSDEEIIGRSVYDIFNDITKEELSIYVDTAINSASNRFTKYLKVLNRELKALTFQPKEGYCCCVMNSL